MSAIEKFRHAGERHAKLATLAGTWRIAMRVWDKAGKITAQSDDITATKTLVHDGRYIREDLSGPIGSGTHEKTSMLGFNNIRGRYEYMTADSYDAVILLYTTAPGTALDDKRIEVFADYVHAGDREEPTGTLVTIRTVIEIESLDLHVLRNYYHAPGQPEFQFLEYTYHRNGLSTCQFVGIELYRYLSMANAVTQWFQIKADFGSVVTKAHSVPRSRH